MSNSVQRMAKAGETVRKLGFCMAVVFAGMLMLLPRWLFT